MRLLRKVEFITKLGTAVSQGLGFAAGKIGDAEQRCMLQPIVLGEDRLQGRARRAYELSLKFHAFNQAALFPRDVQFYARYNEFYIPHIRNLNALGLFGVPSEARLVQYYDLQMPMMMYRDQEPDRSVPNDPALCYLQFFRNKRILLVSSQADVLRERANRETFETVWQKTGKPWFYPASVEALSFPYGWAPQTQSQYGDSLKLFESIAAKIRSREFDVALIAAGGLGVPLASEVKKIGKIGLSLGGHLQVLFGAIGRRWRSQENWLNDYVTEAWIDMPDPRSDWRVTGADGGAYW